MRKYLLVFAAFTLTLVIALPVSALEFKYGGMFQTRIQSIENVADGNEAINDNQNYLDQRLRMYFSFVGSENLQFVTKWEADTLWGLGTGTRHGGGRVGADEVNLEMKNAYLDFAIPTTPLRTKVGVQALNLMDGWILNDDFSSATVEAKFDPVRLELGYIAARIDNVTTWSTRADEYYVNVGAKQGPFSGNLIALYQYARDTDVAPFLTNTSTIDPGLIGNRVTGNTLAPLIPNYIVQNPTTGNSQFIFTNTGASSATGSQGTFRNFEDNHFFDLGLALKYKIDLLSAYVNFIKNFGGFDSLIEGIDDDYTGWMVETGANFFCGPFTFTVFGFYTSGGDVENPDQFGNFYRHPAGHAHYWAEIMGVGTFLNTIVAPGPADDRIRTQVGYASAEGPSNLWTISGGAAWQALEGTKLTLNYYYLSAAVPVIAGFDEVTGDSIKTSSIGHEFDFYLDQKIVDKLMMRFGAAYLFANDAYTAFNDDDNAYKIGAQLQWLF